MLKQLGRAMLLVLATGTFLVACQDVPVDVLVKRAEQSIAEKQYQAALVDLRTALRQDPQNVRLELRAKVCNRRTRKFIPS